MSAPTTAFESVHVALDQAMQGSDLLRYFRVFLIDASSEHTSADTHILTSEIELDPVSSGGAVEPTNPPNGQRDTAFSRLFEWANFDTEARYALLCSVESSVADQLGDGGGGCKIKAVISGKFTSGAFRVSGKSVGSSKHDWEPLWRNMMQRKLTACQNIARSLERSFTSIDVDDGCVHHLEPVRLIDNRISGFAVIMDDHIEYRSVHSQAVTVRCRRAIRGRLSHLQILSERIDAMLRTRAMSEAWNQDVAGQLQGIVDQDEGAESGSDTAIDPENDESADLAFAEERVQVILGRMRDEV